MKVRLKTFTNWSSRAAPSTYNWLWRHLVAVSHSICAYDRHAIAAYIVSLKIWIYYITNYEVISCSLALSGGPTKKFLWARFFKTRNSAQLGKEVNQLKACFLKNFLHFVQSAMFGSFVAQRYLKKPNRLPHWMTISIGMNQTRKTGFRSHCVFNLKKNGACS